jgi:tricarballylate dehydrogenase
MLHSSHQDAAAYSHKEPAIELLQMGPRLDTYDVVVIGGGNAALCAALTAKREAKKVLLIERAPKPFRGGNTRHTRDIRYAHDHDDYTTGPYPVEEFLADLSRITGNQVTGPLARLTVEQSVDIPTMMEEHGVKWQAPLKGTLHLTRTNRFFLGGGKALINTYYDTAARMGVTILYDTPVRKLLINDGRFEGAVITVNGAKTVVRANAVVVASGGFEANLSWLARYWGSGAHNYIVRGGRYNDGTMLADLLAQGAMAVGNPRGFHAIAVDARSPQYDGGIATRVDSVPFGIVVNRTGTRFADEGQDLWPKRYASWGALIAEQPGQMAYSLFDSKVRHLFIPPMYKPLKADSLLQLVDMLEADRATLLDTIRSYNEHIVDTAAFNPGVLDGCATVGLELPKSNWALPIDTPPFYAYPLKPGITFTYLGVAVDEKAHVLMQSRAPMENVYAAGEIMAGNILTDGYLAGLGLTIGAVFGRIAGREAARHA